MSCSRYTAQLSRFLDRELSPRDAADVESHVALCPQCRGLLEHWRRQSAHLRSHLSQHALGEEFVSKVVLAAVQPRRNKEVAAPRKARPLLGFRWIPIAAAVLVGIIVLSLVIPFKGGIGYARVINPGEKLEVLNSNSSLWVRTTAGEILHPGDWVRNPASGSAEILWRDSCRLILEPGTLAQIPPNPSQLVDQILIVRGALLAEIQGGNREFQVRTPAGTVNASAGRFVIRAGDCLLPALRSYPPDSESMHGAIVPFGSVSVLQGQVTVQTEKAARAVQSGETADFAGSQFARHASDSGPVEALLQGRLGPKGNPELSASLVETDCGIRLVFQAADVSLNKILAYAAGTTIHGGEDLAVTGSLSISPGASPQSIVSAVATALGVPIAFRQEMVHGVLYSMEQDKVQVSAGNAGEYNLERAQDSAITISFHAVPAVKAFSVLRTAFGGLPELSAESAWLPISIEGTAANSVEASSWVVKTLGLQLKEEDSLVNIIEVGVPAIAPEGSHIVGHDSPPLTSPRLDASRGRSQPGDKTTRPPLQKQEVSIPTQGDSSIDPYARTADSSMRAAVDESVYQTYLQGVYSSGGLTGGGSSSAKGKSSRKTYEILGSAVASKTRPSTHLIWPPLESNDISSGLTNYQVTNSMGFPAHTLWRGYDDEGRLVAEYALVIDNSSSALLNLQADLPSALDIAGHWETISDVPLSGSCYGGGGVASGIGLPVASEQLPRQWSIPAWWLTEVGGRFWFANPGGGEAEAVLTLMQGGRVFSVERVIIPDHGALIWPDLSSTMDFSEAPAGATIEIYIVRGSVAAGLAK